MAGKSKIEKFQWKVNIKFSGGGDQNFRGKIDFSPIFYIDFSMKIFNFEIFMLFRISNLHVEVTAEHRGGIGVGPRKFQGSQPTGI